MPTSARWVLPLVASVLVLAATWARCPGCLDRTRLNESCVWTGDTSFRIDHDIPAHQQHLVHDAQLAEDLAVRYADAAHQRLYGSPGHGGLIERKRVVKECMARLVTSIETTHAVTVQDIESARPRRNLAYDAGVWLSFALVYVGASLLTVRWLEQRFSGSARPLRLIVTALTSLATSVLGLQLGTMWTMVSEIVRLHNGHFGTFRATRPPWMQHLDALFIAGAALVWVVALFRRRFLPHDDEFHVPVSVGSLLR